MTVHLIETPPRGIPVPVRAQWASPRSLVLAAVGVAAGFGYAWRLPAMAGPRGGGAFVLVFVLALAVVGWPLLLAELAVGRRGGRNPVGGFRRLARAEGASVGWQAVGWAMVGNTVVLLSLHAVLAGWVLAYLADTASVRLLVAGDPTRAARRFAALLASPATLSLWSGAFLGVVALCSQGGLRRGVERAMRWMVPLLVVLLLVLATASAAGSGGLREAMRWLLTPDFGALDGRGLLAAIGLAVLTTGAGAGVLLASGSHLGCSTPLPRVATGVALADLGLVVLCALAVLPVVLAQGLTPSQGPGLLFVAVPAALGGSAAGPVLAMLFFGALALALAASAMALLEPGVALLVERARWPRPRAAWVVAAVAWLPCLGAIMAFGAPHRWRLGGPGVFDVMTHATGRVVVPLTALGLALFVGWGMSAESAAEETELSGSWFRLWRGMVRWVVPVAILATLVLA